MFSVRKLLIFCEYGIVFPPKQKGCESIILLFAQTDSGLPANLPKYLFFFSFIFYIWPLPITKMNKS